MTERGPDVPRPPRSAPTVQQGRSTKVPTVQQGRPRSAPTRQQGGTVSAPTVQQGAGATNEQVDGSPVFPEQLRDRYVPLDVRGTGSEAVVWRCRKADSAEEIAVKVHFAGKPIDEALLHHLDDERFHRHVPRLAAFGTIITPYGQVAWVAMELLHTTLAELIASEWARGGMSEKRARELLVEVAAALEFWQTSIGRNPLDFKPDNLMLRSPKRSDIVIADFGGVTAFTASQQVGGVITAAVAYTPPEERWQEKGSPFPWWSLGEIAFELITGRARFRDADGELMPDRVIDREKYVGKLESHLKSVPSERWRLLIRGLLTRDPHDRWTGPQVREWAAGGTPHVADDHVRTTNTQPEHGPITFADGRVFNDPASLAAHLLDNPRAAEAWLLAEGRQELSDWLKREKLDRRFDVAQLRGMAGNAPRLHRVLLAFGAAFAPTVTPRYRGQQLDAESLFGFVAADPNGFAFAREIVQQQVFGSAAAYRCTHDTCGHERCARLDEVAAALPGLIADAKAAFGPLPGGPLSDAETDRLHAIALLLVLRPDQAKDLAGVGGVQGRTGPPWWRQLSAAARRAHADTDTGKRTILVAAVMRARADGERTEQHGQQIGRLRTMASSALPRLGVAVLTTLAALLVLWVAVLLRNGNAAFTEGPTNLPVAFQAAGTQVFMFPIILLLAAEAAFLARGAAIGWIGGVCAISFAIGLFTFTLPPFTFFSTPVAMQDLLVEYTKFWNGGNIVGALLSLGLALACAWGANKLAATYVKPTPGAMPGAATSSWRRVAAGLLLLVTMLGAVWSVGVLRSTLQARSDATASAGIGTSMAVLQSGYLLVLILIALAAASRWPRTRAIFVLGLVAAIALGAWGAPVPGLDALWLPLAQGPLLWLSSFWDEGAFWAALLLCVPLTLLSGRLAYRLGRGR